MRPRDVLPSPTVPGIFLRFLEVLKPSLEALTIRVFDYELIFQISQSLCHEGAIMPRVRELDTRLSLKSPHTFEAISMNYPSVTKLALTPVIDVEPLTFLENLRLPELRTLRLWLPGRTSGFWRGLSSSPLLDELCVTLAAPMQRDEVAELCRFFSHTKITRLSISVEVLDPRLVDFLAGYFPNLRDIALKAKHLMQPSWPFEEGYLSSFRDEMHERRYPKLRELERFSLSFLGADIPAEAVISVLAECLPGVEFKHGAMSFLSSPLSHLNPIIRKSLSPSTIIEPTDIAMHGHPAPYYQPPRMENRIIENYYNRGQPMSDLALHAAQYFRPRRMNAIRIQSQYLHEQPTSPSKRKAAEIIDKANNTTISTPLKNNATGPGIPDTPPTKRAKLSPSQERGGCESTKPTTETPVTGKGVVRQNVPTPTPPTSPITLAHSVEAMLAKQALKPKRMILRRARPADIQSDAAAGDKSPARAAVAADKNNAMELRKEEGNALAPSEMLAKDTSSRMRKGAEAPTKGPTTSFASPPNYRK
ncbi:hypothetical protein EYR40_009163 [Pleurotus pulmonarius]|nr:hypothetical protein EYR40_009163 [Pleurotus pulmonarius]